VVWVIDQQRCVPSPERGRVREGVLLAKRIFAAEEIAVRPDPHPVC
jgi:hypothetical protein